MRSLIPGPSPGGRRAKSVLGMAPEDDCMREMFVIVGFVGRKLGVPLAQIEPIGADAATRETVEDWRYWMAMGYEF